MHTLQIISYEQLEDKNEFYLFCRNESQELSQPARTNLWTEDWEIKRDTLIYQIKNRMRYFNDNGQFHLIMEGRKIVGCGGVYKSVFSDNIAIAGCRTWITKSHRNFGLPREYLLPAHKKWANENDCKIVAVTFNDYNKNLIEVFKKRKRFGEKPPPRKPHHLFYSNLNTVNFPVNIQYTKQWLIYEKLDVNFEFDWNTIAWK